MNKSWITYILRCADDSLYTGSTTDITRRLIEHNESPKGATYTKSRRPVKIEYTESFVTRSEAAKREAAIKSLERSEKLALIKTRRKP